MQWKTFYQMCIHKDHGISQYLCHGTAMHNTAQGAQNQNGNCTIVTLRKILKLLEQWHDILFHNTTHASTYMTACLLTVKGWSHTLSCDAVYQANKGPLVSKYPGLLNVAKYGAWRTLPQSHGVSVLGGVWLMQCTAVECIQYNITPCQGV